MVINLRFTVDVNTSEHCTMYLHTLYCIAYTSYLLYIYRRQKLKNKIHNSKKRNNNNCLPLEYSKS